ncbi:MAG: choice-of-anchor tandem repeat GloVer-containing protein [Candidatus Cybelea sp.]
MRISSFGNGTLAVCAAAMLAACGAGSGTPFNLSSTGLPAERTNTRPAYSELYSFEGSPGDGAYPYAGLVNVNGTLYGTTSYGGAECYSSYGCGTVFSITTSGAEKVLYAFGKGGYNDGADPTDDLIAVAGTLYGTTSGGGTRSDGTVFAITPSGTETVLHSFKGSPDGFDPFGGLVNVKGTLYGTTEYGGRGDGTVFAITTSGKETVLYSFGGGSGDGAHPYAGLINVNGMLYGTTYSGGGAGCYSNFGCGTIFSITTAGKERLLHIFGTGTDGENPRAGLINVNGTLYGTTTGGGANGDGTVFAITTSGNESVLYSFKGRPDGRNPVAGLINVNGTLYGTTLDGGRRCPKHGGCGAIFSITTSGVETVLHSLGGSGGAYPEAGLINVNGTLYGTTLAGGTSNGTVFSLSP